MYDNQNFDIMRLKLRDALIHPGGLGCASFIHHTILSLLMSLLIFTSPVFPRPSIPTEPPREAYYIQPHATSSSLGLTTMRSKGVCVKANRRSYLHSIRRVSTTAGGGAGAAASEAELPVNGREDRDFRALLDAKVLNNTEVKYDYMPWETCCTMCWDLQECVMFLWLPHRTATSQDVSPKQQSCAHVPGKVDIASESFQPTLADLTMQEKGCVESDIGHQGDGSDASELSEDMLGVQGREWNQITKGSVFTEHHVMGQCRLLTSRHADAIEYWRQRNTAKSSTQSSPDVKPRLPPPGETPTKEQISHFEKMVRSMERYVLCTPLFGSVLSGGHTISTRKTVTSTPPGVVKEALGNVTAWQSNYHCMRDCKMDPTCDGYTFTIKTISVSLDYVARNEDGQIGKSENMGSVHSTDQKDDVVQVSTFTCNLFHKPVQYALDRWGDELAVSPQTGFVYTASSSNAYSDSKNLWSDANDEFDFGLLYFFGKREQSTYHFSCVFNPKLILGGGTVHGTKNSMSEPSDAQTVVRNFAGKDGDSYESNEDWSSNPNSPANDEKNQNESDHVAPTQPVHCNWKWFPSGWSNANTQTVGHHILETHITEGNKVVRSKTPAELREECRIICDEDASKQCQAITLYIFLKGLVTTRGNKEKFIMFKFPEATTKDDTPEMWKAMCEIQHSLRKMISYSSIEHVSFFSLSVPDISAHRFYVLPSDDTVRPMYDGDAEYALVQLHFGYKGPNRLTAMQSVSEVIERRILTMDKPNREVHDIRSTGTSTAARAKRTQVGKKEGLSNEMETQASKNDAQFQSLLSIINARTSLGKDLTQNSEELSRLEKVAEELKVAKAAQYVRLVEVLREKLQNTLSEMKSTSGKSLSDSPSPMNPTTNPTPDSWKQQRHNAQCFSSRLTPYLSMGYESQRSGHSRPSKTQHDPEALSAHDRETAIGLRVWKLLSKYLSKNGHLMFRWYDHVPLDLCCQECLKSSDCEMFSWIPKSYILAYTRGEMKVPLQKPTSGTVRTCVLFTREQAEIYMGLVQLALGEVPKEQHKAMPGFNFYKYYTDGNFDGSRVNVERPGSLHPLLQIQFFLPCKPLYDATLVDGMVVEQVGSSNDFYKSLVPDSISKRFQLDHNNITLSHFECMQRCHSNVMCDAYTFSKTVSTLLRNDDSRGHNHETLCQLFNSPKFFRMYEDSRYRRASQDNLRLSCIFNQNLASFQGPQWKHFPDGVDITNGHLIKIVDALKHLSKSFPDFSSLNGDHMAEAKAAGNEKELSASSKGTPTYNANQTRGSLDTQQIRFLCKNICEEYSETSDFPCTGFTAVPAKRDYSWIGTEGEHIKLKCLLWYIPDESVGIVHSTINQVLDNFNEGEAMSLHKFKEFVEGVRDAVDLVHQEKSHFLQPVVSAYSGPYRYVENQQRLLLEMLEESLASLKGITASIEDIGVSLSQMNMSIMIKEAELKILMDKMNRKYERVMELRNTKAVLSEEGKQLLISASLYYMAVCTQTDIQFADYTVGILSGFEVFLRFLSSKKWADARAKHFTENVDPEGPAPPCSVDYLSWFFDAVGKFISESNQPDLNVDSTLLFERITYRYIAKCIGVNWYKVEADYYQFLDQKQTSFSVSELDLIMREFMDFDEESKTGTTSNGAFGVGINPFARNVSGMNILPPYDPSASDEQVKDAFEEREHFWVGEEAERQWSAAVREKQLSSAALLARWDSRKSVMGEEEIQEMNAKVRKWLKFDSNGKKQDLCLESSRYNYKLSDSWTYMLDKVLRANSEIPQKMFSFTVFSDDLGNLLTKFDNLKGWPILPISQELYEVGITIVLKNAVAYVCALLVGIDIVNHSCGETGGEVCLTMDSCTSFNFDAFPVSKFELNENALYEAQDMVVYDESEDEDALETHSFRLTDEVCARYDERYCRRLVDLENKKLKYESKLKKAKSANDPRADIYKQGIEFTQHAILILKNTHIQKLWSMRNDIVAMVDSSTYIKEAFAKVDSVPESITSSNYSYECKIVDKAEKPCALHKNVATSWTRMFVDKDIPNELLVHSCKDQNCIFKHNGGPRCADTCAAEFTKLNENLFDNFCKYYSIYQTSTECIADCVNRFGSSDTCSNICLDCRTPCADSNSCITFCGTLDEGASRVDSELVDVDKSRNSCEQQCKMAIKAFKDTGDCANICADIYPQSGIAPEKCKQACTKHFERSANRNCMATECSSCPRLCKEKFVAKESCSRLCETEDVKILSKCQENCSSIFGRKNNNMHSQCENTCLQIAGKDDICRNKCQLFFSNTNGCTALCSIVTDSAQERECPSACIQTLLRESEPTTKCLNFCEDWFRAFYKMPDKPADCQDACRSQGLSNDVACDAFCHVNRSGIEKGTATQDLKSCTEKCQGESKPFQLCESECLLSLKHDCIGNCKVRFTDDDKHKACSDLCEAKILSSRSMFEFKGCTQHMLASFGLPVTSSEIGSQKAISFANAVGCRNLCKTTTLMNFPECIRQCNLLSANGKECKNICKETTLDIQLCPDTCKSFTPDKLVLEIGTHSRKESPIFDCQLVSLVSNLLAQYENGDPATSISRMSKNQLLLNETKAHMTKVPNDYLSILEKGRVRFPNLDGGSSLLNKGVEANEENVNSQRLDPYVEETEQCKLQYLYFNTEKFQNLYNSLKSTLADRLKFVPAGQEVEDLLNSLERRRTEQERAVLDLIENCMPREMQDGSRAEGSGYHKMVKDYKAVRAQISYKASMGWWGDSMRIITWFVDHWFIVNNEAKERRLLKDFITAREYARTHHGSAEVILGPDVKTLSHSSFAQGMNSDATGQDEWDVCSSEVKHGVISTLQDIVKTYQVEAEPLERELYVYEQNRKHFNSMLTKDPEYEEALQAWKQAATNVSDTNQHLKQTKKNLALFKTNLALQKRKALEEELHLQSILSKLKTSSEVHNRMSVVQRGPLSENEE
eukprot:Nk52_evm4s485 gene=Nk52_evmTU4s485